MTSAVHIEVLENIEDNEATAFARLVPQLSSSQPPGPEQLRKIVGQQGVQLLVARDEHSEIVGTLCLVVFQTPTGVHALIEDVVVDQTRRGAGIASALVEHALLLAKDRGARQVDLTSRPSRTTANALYVRLGFERRDTNVYRHSLEP